MTAKINPGALRIVSPTYDGGFLAPHDLAIEVQKEDGSWLRLRTATELTITIKPDAPVIAKLGLLTSEIDLWGIDPSEVEFVRANVPTWRSRLMRVWRRVAPGKRHRIPPPTSRPRGPAPLPPSRPPR